MRVTLNGLLRQADECPASRRRAVESNQSHAGASAVAVTVTVVPAVYGDTGSVVYVMPVVVGRVMSGTVALWSALHTDWFTVGSTGVTVVGMSQPFARI